MARILITGGAGFIGSHLIEALLKEDHDVVVLDNFCSGKASNLDQVLDRIQLIEADVLSVRPLSKEIGQVDNIYHLAALISGYESLADPDSYVRSNLEGTQRVIDFAGEVGASRIIFASSSTIYGDQDCAAIAEGAPPRPLTTYALTKLAGEHLLRLYAPLRGYSHCCLRLFNVYGPRQGVDHPYANVTCKFSHAAATGASVDLYGNGEQSRDFVYVDDVVRAFVNVLDHSDQEIYNVGTGVATSINTLLQCLERIVGRRIERITHEPWPNDLRTIRADTSRFSEEFGPQLATPLDQGLKATVGSFTSR